MSPAFAAEHAEAEAQAIHASGDGLGQIFGPVLDGGTCTAVWDGGPDATPTPPEKCGDNLTLSPENPIAYTQNATAGAPSHSTADATTAPVGLAGINSIDISDVIDAMKAWDASDVLTGAGQNVGGLLDQLLIALGLKDDLDTALNQLTDNLDDVLDVQLQIGAVRSLCTADPGTASGNAGVTGDDGPPFEGTVSLPTGDTIPLTLTTGTAPNSKLIGSVAGADGLAGQIVDDVAQTFADANGPIGTILNALAGNVLQQQAFQDGIDALFDGLDQVLEPLGDGLEPIVEGTVNEQFNGAGQGGSDDFEGQTPPDDGDITVTALDAVLFQGTPLEGRLELGRVSCGPNAVTGGPGGTPALQFDKDADTDHGDAKFTLTVHNSTNGPIGNVFVQDFYGSDIDAGDVKDINVSKGTFDKNTGRWTVGTLGAGETATLTFKVDVSKSDLDDGVKNAACVNKASKPDNIQKNDGVANDTDGCDEDTAKKNDDSDSDSDSDDSDDSDSDDNPRSVDSGLNDGGNLGILAITGLLAASTLVGSAARQRLLLDR
jgi:hypothetical protein